MADVIDIFSRKPIPAQDIGSELVEEFIEDHYWQAIGAMEAVSEATTEAEFWERIEQVRALVDEWPDDQD